MTVSFVASLLFQDGENRFIEPRVYVVSHPRIAYVVALNDGRNDVLGREFVGLARLEATTNEPAPIGKMETGSARTLVVPEKQLTALIDPRWRDVAHDEDELRGLLREPELLFEMPNLDAVAWEQLTHAYGHAGRLPHVLRKLAAVGVAVREEAASKLCGLICHQGTLYDATAAALPFVLEIVRRRDLPVIEDLAYLLQAVAESASGPPERIKEAWAFRKKHFGEIYAAPTAEMAEAEVEANLAALRVLRQHRSALERLAGETDREIAECGRAALAAIGD